MRMNLHQRIFKARKDAGLTQDQLAEAVGKTRSAVAQWESGDVRPRHATMVQIAKATNQDIAWLENGVTHSDIIGLPTIGEVAAGVWKEGSVEFKATTQPVSPDPRYPLYAQRLYRVAGTSLNKIAADGSYLHAIDIHQGGIKPAHGDVVIARRMQHDLAEYTAKRLLIIGDKAILQPESNDPDWQEPITIEGDESTDVEITDIVIAVWAPVLRGTPI